ncbi:MAG TPA: family 1 glycosylhydrolase, partial [Candidatus Paceibacterota bacterium]|nr:family 1 glycosylhydrolase [Candidatus Paceibacterota bacterium]
MSETGHVLKRSALRRLAEPDFFFWATGIEDTFITEPWPGTGRTLDEYELTGHYSRWEDDLKLIAELGVTHARYGIPWHRINPQRGVWDWQFADQTLEKLLELKVDPIVDLVHYGLPCWIEGAYLNPDFPSQMAEYAARAAERFKGRIHLWTPLNEPRVTAWYCGKLGWWPPFKHGWNG